MQENVRLSATGTDVAGPSLVCLNCSDINGKDLTVMVNVLVYYTAT